jgi:hypothetical protein
LVSNIDRANGRTGKWALVEDRKLKDAVKPKAARIGSRFPRWFRVERDYSVRVDGTMPWIPASTERVGRTGKWVEDEGTKLKDAALTHGDKNWKGNFRAGPGSTEQTVFP